MADGNGGHHEGRERQPWLQLLTQQLMEQLLQPQLHNQQTQSTAAEAAASEQRTSVGKAQNIASVIHAMRLIPANT